MAKKTEEAVPATRGRMNEKNRAIADKLIQMVADEPGIPSAEAAKELGITSMQASQLGDRLAKDGDIVLFKMANGTRLYYTPAAFKKAEAKLVKERDAAIAEKEEAEEAKAAKTTPRKAKAAEETPAPAKRGRKTAVEEAPAPAPTGKRGRKGAVVEEAPTPAPAKRGRKASVVQTVEDALL